jgi:hypothetical protein
MEKIHEFLEPPYPQLVEHARQLYSLRSNSRKVPKYSVTYLSWKPAPGKCHQNCEYWEKLYPGDTAVYGWLCFDFSASGFFRFASHTIIRTQSEYLVDITPTNTEELRPFLEDFTLKSKYEQFVTDLHAKHSVTLLDHKI